MVKMCTNTKVNDLELIREEKCNPHGKSHLQSVVSTSSFQSQKLKRGHIP